MAYLGLAISYSDSRETGLAAEYFRKPYAMRERVSAWERLGIEGFCYFKVTGVLKKAAETFDLSEQTYSTDIGPLV